MNARLARLRAALGIAFALLLSGCFTVQYRLPPRSYFGQLPARPGERAREFDHHAMKNWYLAGLGAWSSFNMDNLEQTEPGHRIEALELETRFSTLDILIWVIPGQFYGYYLWAPRTLRMQGREIASE